MRTASPASWRRICASTSPASLPWSATPSPKRPPARAGGRGSVLGEAAQQRDGLLEHSALLRGEAVGGRAREPPLALAAIVFERLAALIGELDEDPSAVARVCAASDQAVGLQIADRLRHRLRSYTLGDRKITDRHRALAVDAPEHGALGEREAVLGAEPAHEVTEHHAQLAGEA